MKRQTRLMIIALSFMIPLTVIALSLVLFMPTTLIHLFKINELFIIFVALIILLPIGKTRITCHKKIKPLPVFYWILSIIALQLFSFFLFYGQLATLAKYDIFARHIPQQAMTTLVSASLNQLLHNAGLFPWSLIAFFASALILLKQRYPEQKTPLFHLSPCQRGVRKTITGAFIIPSRIAINLLLTITIVFAAIWLCLFVFKNKAAILHPFPGVFSALLLMLFLFGQRTKKKLQQLSQTKQGAFVHSIAQLVLLTVLLLATSFLFIKLEAAFPKMQHTLAAFTPENQAHFKLLYQQWTFAFWILAAPFLGSFVLLLSQGKTLRSMLMVTLALPLIAALVLHIHWHLYETIAGLTQLLALLPLFYCLRKDSARATLWLGYCPTSTIKPRSKLESNWAMASIFLGLFSLGALSVFMMLMAANAIMITIIALFALRLFFKKSSRLK
jgi:choline-glycine betaine transporter